MARGSVFGPDCSPLSDRMRAALNDALGEALDARGDGLLSQW
jgi:hypothetical protein